MVDSEDWAICKGFAGVQQNLCKIGKFTLEKKRSYSWRLFFVLHLNGFLSSLRKMMIKPLLAAATEPEITGLLAPLALEQVSPRLYRGPQIDLLVTGIGMVNTALHLGQLLVQDPQVQYHPLIHIGICGSYRTDWPVGTVVQVVEDIYAELGAEDGADFLPLEKLGFVNFKAGDRCYYNIINQPDPWPLDWPQARGLTVNRVHGAESSIAQARQYWQPEIESMEGAAFFQTALEAQRPFLALRSVSNPVTRRDPAAWNIPRALAALHQAVLQVVQSLTTLNPETSPSAR